MREPGSTSTGAVEEQPEPLRFRDRYRTLFTLMLPALLLGLGRGFTVPVLPALALEFDANVAAAGLMVIAPMLGSLAVTLPTGYLIDRVGRRKLLIVAPAITSLSAFLVLRAASYPELLAYLSLGGIAQQMWQMSRLAAIADSSAQNRRGRQITGMASAGRIGTLMGPLLGGLIGELLGVRVPFAIYGVAAALAVVPMYVFMPETSPTVLARRRGETGIDEPNASWSTLLTFRVGALFLAQFLANAGRGGAIGHGGVFLIFAAYTYGTGPAALGVIGTVVGILGIPIMLTSGQVMDRFGRKRQIVPAAVAVGTGLALMAATAAAGWSFTVFVVAFVWINLGVSAMAGSMQTLGTDVAPPGARGRFFGMIRLVAGAGSLSNPAAFSVSTAVVAGSAGFATAFGIMAGAALLTALVVGTLVRETLQRSR
ncbi:MAG: MFS transporter [Chloroflexi bacterium]|nr:MFS transporter [Chloroflexota bacterium]